MKNMLSVGHKILPKGLIAHAPGVSPSVRPSIVHHLNISEMTETKLHISRLMGQVNDRLFVWCGSPDQDGCHACIW